MPDGRKEGKALGGLTLLEVFFQSWSVLLDGIKTVCFSPRRNILR